MNSYPLLILRSFPQVPMLFVSLCLVMFSCKSAIDLDTERTLVPTNLPEITDVEPKSISLQTTATVTITGKNFVGVRRVAFDTITASTFRVESSTRITATFARPPVPFLVSNAFYTATVTTSRGIATSDQLIAIGEALSGRIDGEDISFDSLYFYGTKDSFGTRISTATPRAPLFSKIPKGYYYLPASIFNPVASYSVLNPPLDGSFTLQPFLTGYSFTPTQRTFRGIGHTTGGLDFTMKKVPSNQMPDITDIQPRGGVSNSSDQTANTELTIRGKGLAGVKKVLIAIQYGNPRNPFENLGLEEASIVRIDNDGQMVFRLPQLNRTQALSGGVYVNCRVFILTENTSLYASQRISIQYR